MTEEDRGELVSQRELIEAIRDVQTMKQTAQETHRVVIEVQSSLNTLHEKYATKDEVKTLRADVDKLKGWRQWLMGGVALGAFLIGAASKLKLF